MPKKSKKSKKHKKLKEKKQKKSKHVHSDTSESESNSSDESSEYEWTEKKTKKSNPQMAKHEDWMSVTSFVPTFSIHDVKINKKETVPDRNLLDKPGQSSRELNPHWRNGGNGLPEENENDKAEVKLMSHTVGNQEAEWLKRALKRAKEQAKDEGIPLEYIVAERYGSLENLYRLINEAENRQKYSKNESNRRNHHNIYESSGLIKNRFMKPNDDYKSDDTSNNYTSRSRGSHEGWRKQKKSKAQEEEIKSVIQTTYSSRNNYQAWRKQNQPEEKEEIKKIENSYRLSNSHQSCRKQKQFEESDYAKKVQENVLFENKTENLLLTDADMNSLASRILKAEIMGNTSLVKELTDKLEKARKSREQAKSENTDDFILLTTTNSRGITQPVPKKNDKSDNNKRKTYQTHANGKRVRYFEDDEKYSIAEMFEREQMKTAVDSNLEFVQLAAKTKADKDYEVDDLFMEQTLANKSRKEKDIRQSAIDKQKTTEKALDNCTWCLTNNKLQKHLIISTSAKCYLSVPYFNSLTDGHCLISPIYHTTCTTLLDEDIWEEMLNYCRKLVRMFQALNQDVVFFENAMNFKYYPHMVIHCVPIPYESGNLAPIYFKKAILECEKEWSQNKKLVNVNKMDVKRAIPTGLPYFMVNFGLEYGFAHVIEEEKYFPKNFAQEVIGGMLDLDHKIWRKQHSDDFETQCKKVNTFKSMWNKIESNS